MSPLSVLVLVLVCVYVVNSAVLTHNLAVFIRYATRCLLTTTLLRSGRLTLVFPYIFTLHLARLDDGNSRQMLFQVSLHLTVEISTVNLVIALKNQDQMVNLVITLKKQVTHMIQLVPNQVEMTNPIDFRDGTLQSK